MSNDINHEKNNFKVDNLGLTSGKNELESNDLGVDDSGSRNANASTEVITRNDITQPDLEKDSFEPPYTIFSSRELYIFGTFIGLATIWSVLSSSLFFPAIPNISKEFNVSTELANISIVVYLVFQSFTPMIISSASDTYGRRPVSLALLISYTAVCIGLSRVRVYWALLVLRCVQATSIASMVSTSFGVVGDLTPKLKRGGYGGYVSGLTLNGQAFGGLLGGLLVSRWNWPGIFVFCAIGGGISFILNFIFVPETNRKIVGNQSIEPKSIINKSPILHFPSIKPRIINDKSTLLIQHQKSNVWNTIKIFCNKIVFFTMLPGGLQFATWTVSQAALSSILKDSYGFSEIHIGLAYLPSGFGSILASVIGGRILNWNYKRRKNQWKELPSPKAPFNLHATRSEFSTRITIINASAVIVFGWCLDKKVNLAPILIMLFINAFCCVWTLTILQTLLVDLYPAQSSASSSCLNLMRGLLSAVFVAAQQQMMDSISVGGAFTLLTGIFVLSFIIFKVVIYFDSRDSIKPVSSTINL